MWGKKRSSGHVVVGGGGGGFAPHALRGFAEKM